MLPEYKWMLNETKPVRDDGVFHLWVPEGRLQLGVKVSTRGGTPGYSKGMRIGYYSVLTSHLRGPEGELTVRPRYRTRRGRR